MKIDAQGLTKRDILSRNSQAKLVFNNNGTFFFLTSQREFSKKSRIMYSSFQHAQYLPMKNEDIYAKYAENKMDRTNK